MNFNPDVEADYVAVHMGFGSHTTNIEQLCGQIEERRNLLHGYFEEQLKKMLEEELRSLNLDKDSTIHDSTSYGSFQYTIRLGAPLHRNAVLGACERAARLWWGRYNFSRTPEVRKTQCL